MGPAIIIIFSMTGATLGLALLMRGIESYQTNKNIKKTLNTLRNQ